MHLFKEQGVEDYDAAAKLIPVIDYRPYFAGTPGALERTATNVAHACENVGFFYALNHGVPQELIDRAFAASRRFHALPLAEKLALKLNENKSATCRSTPRCRVPRPSTRRRSQTKTKASLSATIAGRSTPM
jgi:isopenicillin N synthase-like dioxygenase